MTDWANVLARFALYLDLMLMFGLPLFALHSLRGQERSSGIASRLIVITVCMAVLGMVLSCAGLAVMTKAMTGALTYDDIERHTYQMMVTETAYGIACLVRLLALLAYVLVGLSMKQHPMLRFVLLSLSGAIAVATLAWGGHGVMDEAIRGYFHLLADIVHLIAGGAWVGALAAFLLMLQVSHQTTRDHIDTLSRALNGFAAVGTVIVVLLIVTGLVNYWMIVGPTISGLFSTLYGFLLLAKLTLFAGMLGLAAANRYRLSPVLGKRMDNSNQVAAMKMLRRSVVLETICVFLILGAVAWLGTLAPA